MKKRQILFLVPIVWTLCYMVTHLFRVENSLSTTSLIKSFPRLTNYMFMVNTGNSDQEEISCKIPDMDPFDSSVSRKQIKPLNCSGNPPSIVDAVGYKLIIDPEKVKTKLNLTAVDHCRYINLTMKPGHDFHVVRSVWSSWFHSSIELLPTEEFLVVECYYNGTLVSKSYPAILRKKPTVEMKRNILYEDHMERFSPKETLSIMFTGLDSMSRHNFMRTMPKTRFFLLNEFKAIEYHQYNKIGLNTFPNVFALLTGKQFKELEKIWNKTINFDLIDDMFLWNHYQRAGYRTAFMLDNVRETAFHYLMKGWTNPPFDYYQRPQSLGSEKDGTYRNTSSHCMGDRAEVAVLFDYFLQLTSLYNNTPTTPYFAYNFMSKISHDDIWKAGEIDLYFLHFFEQLYKRKVMNNTLLIFFSDHGYRFGDFRLTNRGYIEGRNPMLYFVFPPWFEEKYPEVMKNFRTNAHRLMTVYDIHETLEEFLMFDGKPKKVSPLARGISLFNEIPKNRTCGVAGITVEHCACTAVSAKNVTDNILSNVLFKNILTAIAQRTSKHREYCAVLKLKELLSVTEMSSDDNYATNKTHYRVIIATQPGHGKYEASVSRLPGIDKIKVKNVVALHRYRGTADCVDHDKIREFCHCKNAPKQN